LFLKMLAYVLKVLDKGVLSTEADSESEMPPELKLATLSTI